jgi:ferrochelatase
MPRILYELLSQHIISNVRYKSSWKKYQLIGGSPLQNSMDKTAADLEQLLGADYAVSSVYSYSAPFLFDVVSELYAQGIRYFEIMSMYPQASYSTTGSVQASLDQLKAKFHDIQFRFIEDYYDHPLFIDYGHNLLPKKSDRKTTTTRIFCLVRMPFRNRLSNVVTLTLKKWKSRQSL